MTVKLILIFAAFLTLSGAVIAATVASAPNPLLEKWTGPYGGLPPFDKVKVSDFKPAFESAMADNLKEVDAIADNTEPPTFQNTIEAFEKAGATYNRLNTIYGVWSSTMNTGDFQAVQSELDPKIAEFNDKITQNEKLFKRIEAVYNSKDKEQLTPEQQRLIWFDYDNFIRFGAKLDAPSKARLGEINQKLAGLYTSFIQNLLADEGGHVLFLKEADLTGLPQSVKDGMASAAEQKGHKGEWAVMNTRSAMDPFLTYSERRDLREQVWRTFYNRGDNGDEHDNNQIIVQILQLRAERASRSDSKRTRTGASQTKWQRRLKMR